MSEEVKSILGNPDPTPEQSAVVESQHVQIQTETTPDAAHDIDPASIDFSKFIQPDGALADGWKNALPEAVRNEKCLDSIKCFPALVQSYVHAQRAIGANKVAIPGPNASQDEKNAFFKALGRPDSADDYDPAIQDDLKDLVSDDNLGAFKKFAFENGIGQKEFAALVKFDLERAAIAQQQNIQHINDQCEQTVAKIQAQFGAKSDEVLAQARKARDTFGLKDILEAAGIQNNHDVVMALYNIGKSISESKLHGDVPPSVVSDPDLRIKEITANPDDPYYKPDHPLHAERVSEVARLLQVKAKNTR